MISDLAEDLLEEILSRVTVTSLRRLRSTCKRWYHEALFKDPRFIKKHIDKTSREYDAIMLINCKVCSLSSVLDRAKYLNRLALGGTGLTVPNSDELVDVCEAIHCDGILLCTHEANNMLVVWNPFSGQTRWIQPQKHYYNRAYIYALGYDKNQLFRSYKILRVPRIYNRDFEAGRKLDATPEGGLKLEIYEISSDSWRNLDAITLDPYIEPWGDVSLKGNTYWISSNRNGGSDYSLLSFDFSTERFQRLCAPFHHEPCRFDITALSVVGEEHLSFFHQCRKTRNVEIWMTDEIETTFVSWSKFLTIDLKPSGYFFKDLLSFSIIDKDKKVVACCGVDGHGLPFFYMSWIVEEQEKYMAAPSTYFCIGISRRRLPCRHVPRLFGYFPKLAF